MKDFCPTRTKFDDDDDDNDSDNDQVTTGVDRIQLRVKPATTSDPGDREEREQLVYEEYDTEEHEVLAIVLENQSASVGVSLFLSDREVEQHCIIMMMMMTDDASTVRATLTARAGSAKFSSP